MPEVKFCLRGGSPRLARHVMWAIGANPHVVTF